MALVLTTLASCALCGLQTHEAVSDRRQDREHKSSVEQNLEPEGLAEECGEEGEEEDRGGCGVVDEGEGGGNEEV